MPKCYFCEDKGIIQESIIVETDVTNDGDEYSVQPLYSSEWLCATHYEAWLNNELHNGEGE